MGIDLTYTLGGRKVSRDQFFRGLEGEIRKTAADSVCQQIGRTRCAKHGKPARVTELRQTPDGFSVEVDGCCDELVNKAMDSLR